MSEIEKEELKIKVEYGIAYKWGKDLISNHRSGRRTEFNIPKPFHKLIFSKMRGKFARKFVEFTLATYTYEESRMNFTTIYAISIKHKSDNFRRNIAREIVTGRVKRYLKDTYNWKRPIFIHIETEAH